MTVQESTLEMLSIVTIPCVQLEEEKLRMSADPRDLVSDAKNFCDSLTNVFLMKKRDPQTRHLLEKAKQLVESLLDEIGKHGPSSGPLRPGRGGGGMGQLWVKLDELKRENDELRRGLCKSSEDKVPMFNKPQGPGEVIISELHKTRSEKENLQAQVEKLQTAVKELEHVNANMQDEYKRAKIATEASQKTIDKIRKENKASEALIKDLKAENEKLAQRLDQNLKSQVVLKGGRDMEVLTDRCRPSVIALQYNDLESQEWVDAKESLEDSGFDDEEMVTKFLSLVVLQSYKCSSRLLERLEAVVSEFLRRPTLALSSESSTNPNPNPTNPGEKRSLPEEMSSCIKEQLRKYYDKMDPTKLTRIISEELSSGQSNQSEFCENEAVKRFMNACAKITWQMVIQQPPMYLNSEDTTFDDRVHKLWWSCDHATSNKINYYIWPTLYDCKNGNVLVKGSVHAG
ncbi:hypothetical protein ACJMK2_030525 [Sinanodonta woodiana]|uniref:Mitochondria-eating protein n=1 Tax=Sinanodonta woodiana TaxID=1069815 RepID=A0ABD3WZZ2_SINWO